MKLFFLIITSLVFCVFAGTFALAAETPAALPSTVEPSQVGQSLSQPSPELPTAAPSVTAPQAEETPAEAAAKKITFNLKKIILHGNRVYSEQQLSALYQDKIGKTISVADLFHIVQDITNYYRNNGYILSRALLPPQRIKNGVVTIEIIEGFVDKVSVEGNPGQVAKLIQIYGDKIQLVQPLEIKQMEHYLLLVNEVPGVKVRAVLSPSKKTRGAADLFLVTEMKRLTGYASYDNYGTRYIGPQQMTASISVNSGLMGGDATRLTYVKTPRGKELNYIDLSYNAPIGSQGTRLIVGGTQTLTNPLFALTAAKVAGTNENYYVLVQYPILRSRLQGLTLQGGFNYLDSQVTSFDIPVYTDHLRSVSLSASYNFTDRFYGSNFANIGMEQGLLILGATQNSNSTTISRFGGQGDFTKANLQLGRLQAIKYPVSLYATLKGQYAFTPLLAASQFPYGGSQLGRAYDPAEIIGDRGVGGTLELRFDWALERFFINNLQFYGFYDAGEIWNIKKNSGQPMQQSATSTGVGTRFWLTKWVSGNVMFTQPLSKKVAAEQLIGNGSRPRVFFSVMASVD